MVQEVSGVGRVASQPGSQPSASAAGASSPAGADPSRVSDILDRAAMIVEPEGAWTQREFARDDQGDPIDVHDDFYKPVCFCLYGAIGLASGVSPEDYKDADPFLCEVVGASCCGQVATWNDAPNRTQAEVVAKLREAAALAREQGK